MYGKAKGLKARIIPDILNCEIDDAIEDLLSHYPNWTIIDIKFSMIMDINQTPYREAMIIYREED